jgi:hypothetical protein
MDGVLCEAGDEKIDFVTWQSHHGVVLTVLVSRICTKGPITWVSENAYCQNTGLAQMLPYRRAGGGMLVLRWRRVEGPEI